MGEAGMICPRLEISGIHLLYTVKVNTFHNVANVMSVGNVGMWELKKEMIRWK